MEGFQFFITGTSSGIGKALAKECLKRGSKVVGISRRHVLDHPNYIHLNYDLSDSRSYHLINFDRNREATEVVLVNNAGWLGDMKPLGKIDPNNLERAYQINLIAPTILSKLFIEQTESSNSRRSIINLSTGAAHNPVASWSTYCASKAGLEMLAKVIALDHPDVRCLSVSPGVVDTEMQGEIRQMEETHFPEVERFRSYKANEELTSPEEVALKLVDMLLNPEKAPDIVSSLRNYTI